ncbi:hypothetical protein [Spongiactinospora sp. TRM90649]|uniref:hypothetical protein n=1 Tax=Spongiactinospora sp. TRM90649 TaxID=3031114 RepID=UPI0023F8FCC0|nr:hypothetical protein [Spongiactinospora sp. TRM90649]MDF5758392.1 hypothetical protein [Spongiactinospora sp. TRM90649]
MSRRWRDWLNPDDSEGEEELDALLAQTRASTVAAIEGVLDLRAGKEAIFALHGVTRPDPVAAITEPPTGVLAEVCEDIAMLLVVLQVENEPGRSVAQTSAIPYLYTARQLLIQLRVGLLKRAVARAEAERLLASVEHALTQARKRLLQVLPVRQQEADSDPTADLLEAVQDLLGQLHPLGEKIVWLFDDADQSTCPIPTPHV